MSSRPTGRCEFISAYAQPFAMLVVADILGVPEADHRRFREGFGLSGSPGEIGGGQTDQPLNALEWLDDWFATYIEDRRRSRGKTCSLAWRWPPTLTVPHPT